MNHFEISLNCRLVPTGASKPSNLEFFSMSAPFDPIRCRQLGTSYLRIYCACTPPVIKHGNGKWMKNRPLINNFPSIGDFPAMFDETRGTTRGIRGYCLFFFRFPGPKPSIFGSRPSCRRGTGQVAGHSGSAQGATKACR